MGRYYYGDIEGKFWVAIQSSTVAGDRFGCVETHPEVIEYYAEEDNLPTINEELKAIEDKMKEQMAKYDEFFADSRGYNETILAEAGLDPELVQDYADYKFGVKLRDCITEHGSCSFTAEI